MKILLINPSQKNVYGMKMMPAYAPLGLLYIGTVLKNEGHSVRLLDMDTEKISNEKFSAIFNEFHPDAVGISSVTPTLNDALKWAKLSKGMDKDIPVVFGGIHATIAPDELIKKDVVDVVVVGEGELTVKHLFDKFSKDGMDLSGIEGIYFKRQGRIIRNQRRALINDLDLLPFPDRKLLKNPDAFMPPDATNWPVATIMTTRGCPGDCTFCCTKQIFSNKLRPRSVKNIMEEIEYLKNDHGIKEIHIADDTFTSIKNRVMEFCREVKRKDLNMGFQFMNGLRADSVDREILGALKGIGIKTVGYGVETGNDMILNKAKKGIPLAKTREAFKISKELGFETWAFLVLGLPGETEGTIKETIGFTKELDPDFAKFFILKPYPGSEVRAYLDDSGLLLEHTYDDYGLYSKPIHRLPGLEPEKMLYWQKRAFREFYIRPRKMMEHLTRIFKIRNWTQIRLLVNDVLFAFHCMFKGDQGVVDAERTG